MRSIRTALLTIAALGCAGAGLAAADRAHVLLVYLPDGSVERISYTGDVAPGIVPAAAARVAAADPAADPFGSMFGGGSPFATMDRISAGMDARATPCWLDTPTQAPPARTTTWRPARTSTTRVG